MRAIVGIVAMLAGCHVKDGFTCADSAQCHVGAKQGTCESTGYCSFPDSTCASGARYDVDSGDLSTHCVDVPPPMVDAAAMPIDSPMPKPDGPPPYARRIHIHGPQVTGVDYPGVWEADPTNAFCPANMFEPDTPSIDNTVDDALFESGVWNLILQCSFPGIPAGHYRITLPLAEVELNCVAGKPGSRNVALRLEGALVDTIPYGVLGGGCAVSPNGGHPFVKTYQLDITDGTLNLEMTDNDYGGVVFAIAIEQL